MTVIEKHGYFEKGAYTPGLHPSMIGKKIVRVAPCRGDYSHSINGFYGPRSGKDECVMLVDIKKDGTIVYKWEGFHKFVFGEKLFTLEPHWNDGEWIEYKGELKC